MPETDTDRSLAGRARQLETLDKLSQKFGQSLARALSVNVSGGRQLDGVLATIGARLAGLAGRAIAAPVKAGVTGLVKSLINAGAAQETTALARGGVIAQGRVRPFASGGIVAAPTYFPMQGGTGLMGEAGPEAILPLRRGGDGRLGVAAAPGGGPSVTVNITTPDVAGFRRSEAQVAATLARAVARGRRGL
ncbi:phage tail tape measure protein [Methylobacterium sp. Leaf108]|uniref:phage tail tape measure protein n=1 Tax=Methylobacterium sp. Leaf108 TaxID=1736256 RepID=UPI000701633D|nr:phage tail tape measure protein [Methylobacterium sp. Leaf108]KQP61685.1 phage tail protein [Methylobacterium sp. Leaf108]